MKKTKIFFTGLLMITIIGGVLAFKVKTLSVFATCNQANRKCENSPFISMAATTLNGQFAPFDLQGADCKQSGGIFTCFTLTHNNG